MEMANERINPLIGGGGINGVFETKISSKTGTAQGKGTDGGFKGDVTAGEVWAGNNAVLFTDNEGGNLCLYSPSKDLQVQFDAYDGNLRVFTYKNGVISQHPHFRLLRKDGDEGLNATVQFPNLTANTVCILDGNKELRSSAVTADELLQLKSTFSASEPASVVQNQVWIS